MRIKFDPRQTSLFDDVVLLDPPVELASLTQVQEAVAEIVKPAPVRRSFFVLQDEMLADLKSDASKVEANLRAIETLKRVSQQGRSRITNEDRAAMAAYSGWGGLSNVFAPNTDYHSAQNSLKELLTESEYNCARESVLTAYYTEPAVARAMWKMVQSMGFQYGRIVEPACGVGHFIGSMPEDVRNASHVTMVDVDPLTSALADAVYSDRQTVVLPMGVEDLGTHESESYDLVIGNAPFGNYRVHDKRLDRLKLNIHNYFIAKSLDLVRPGGIVALITSSASLENGTEMFWRYVQARADLRMAVRLPGGAFARLGGTDVVADILILQRREKVLTDEEMVDLDPLNRRVQADRSQCTSNFAHWNERNYVNTQFVENPGRLLGQLEEGTNRWGTRLMVRAHDDWLARLESLCADPALRGGFDPDQNVQMGARRTVRDPQGFKNFLKTGFFFDEEGRLMVIDNNGVTSTDTMPANTVRRLEGMTRIRDCALKLLEADAMGHGMGQQQRAELNALYDAFVKQHGSLMAPGNRRLFRADSHAPLLWSLEIYDDETETTLKADIFRGSTVSNAVLSDKATNLEDAISLSYNRFGRMDLGWMAAALDVDHESIVEQLLAVDRIYLDPKDGEWVDSMSYLSGAVRAKYKLACAAKSGDAVYDRNVMALKAVLPPTIPLHEVSVVLGAPWIGANYIQQWLVETFQIGKKEGDFQSNPFCYSSVEVTQVTETASWLVTFNYEKHALFSTEWGTRRMHFWSILRNLLNQQTPEVFDTIENEKGNEVRVINREETLAVQEVAARIQFEFQEWILKDEQRVAVLEENYNELFNGTVNRVYDGSHLVIPGLNPKIALRSAQKDSIWRGIVNGNTLYALAVGGGKTLIQICVAQESKRLGIAAKPMLVVPNHMLEAFAGEYLRAFPRAKVLAASKDDLDGDRRRSLLMRIATNDWDCIIITHGTFGRIGLSDEVIKDHILEAKLKAAAATQGVTDKNVVREASRAAKMVETKLQTLINDDKDSELPGFEQLGIDLLLVDEADLFKNLYFFTKKKRIPGIAGTCSARALDLFIKSRVIKQKRRNDGHGLHFSTATPIANTIGELFIMQTYLQEERLQELGIDSFDAWAANFAREVTCVEVKPEGSGYRMHTRFARFVNVPELMLVFREVAEIRTKKQLNLPEPKLRNGAHQVIAVAATPAQKAFVQELAWRAEKIRNGEVDSKEDNMLAVTGDGRKAALDMRCMDPLNVAEKGTKVDACIQKVHEVWLAGREQRLTQLVFCDLSVPGNKFSVYEYIKAELIQSGVPAEEIAFAQEYKTDKRKAQLHREVRIGKKTVVLGSTELMGFGTNVQDRLVAKHDLDAPWRPRDVEQRDGRILRQGNMNDVVDIFRYVTEGTFDAYMWQGLERKAGFIAQVMENDGNARTIEDVTSQALSFAEVKALASGNPMVIEKAGVDAEVAKLLSLKAVFEKDRREDKREAAWLESSLASTRTLVEKLKGMASRLLPDMKQIVVHGRRFDSVESAVPEICARRAQVMKLLKDAKKRTGGEAYEVVKIGNAVIRYVTTWRGLDCLLSIAGETQEVDISEISWRPSDLHAYLVEGGLQQEIASKLSYSLTRIDKMQADFERYSKSVSITFEHEAKLQVLLERQAEIDAELEIDVDDRSALALAESH